MNWQDIKRRLDSRLADYLCDMKPDYDDSITGFNTAWNIMQDVFSDIEREQGK